MPRVFFATDLHGSEMCWKKFLNAAKFYEADVLICGGDMTGKAIVPIVQEDGRFTVTMAGQEAQTVGQDQVGELENQIRRRGYYPLRLSPERLAVHGLFDAAKVTRLIDRLREPGADHFHVNRVLVLAIFQEWYELYLA